MLFYVIYIETNIIFLRKVILIAVKTACNFLNDINLFQRKLKKKQKKKRERVSF